MLGRKRGRSPTLPSEPNAIINVVGQTPSIVSSLNEKLVNETTEVQPSNNRTMAQHLNDISNAANPFYCIKRLNNNALESDMSELDEHHNMIYYYNKASDSHQMELTIAT